MAYQAITDEQIAELMSNVHSLPTGAKTALRRSAGKLLQNATGNALAAFYTCLPASVNPRLEDICFAASCFECMWTDDARPGKPFTGFLRGLVQRSETSGSAAHRIMYLLETRWGNNESYMLTKLTRFMRMARQMNYRVNCAELLADLARWDWSSKYIQKQWAHEIFGPAPEHSKTEQNAQEA